MLRIIEHIEQMLSVHDCVIIPGFGGFVLQVTPTWYNAEAHRFEPLHKELVFNETLQHNDGLLIESYRQSEATDYRSAYQLVQADVAELKALLERDGQVEMAPIGIFRRGEEGQLIFEASRDTDWLNASMFGLPAFTIEPLAEELPIPMNVEKMEKRRPDVYYIPVNRRLVRWVAAAVVAIVVFLSASTSVEEVNRSAYTASFVPTEMLNGNMQKDEPSPAEPEPTSTKVEVTPRAETKPAPVEKPKAETKVVKAPAPKREAAKTVEAAPQKRYYIVIASLASSEQAAQYMKGVGQKDCPNMAVLQTKGKYRVYADRFTDKAAAEKYQNTLRKNPKYKDAWLFTWTSK